MKGLFSMTIYIDISNLMRADFPTGIQRVVREVTLRMMQREDITLVLLVYSVQKNCYQVVNKDKFKEYHTQQIDTKDGMVSMHCLHFEDIPVGSIFFDLDNAWNTRLKRSYLYPILKQKGIKIVTQIYDIIPVTHPQYCHETTTLNFLAYIGANLRYADLLITSAQATSDALNSLCDKIGIDRVPTKVVPLGCDFLSGGNSESRETVDSQVKKIVSDGRKYLLMVGTIEPRKNHSLVIDALESGLADKGVSVIFAGKIGWNVEQLKDRMENHPLYGKQLFFFERPNDATINYLYKNAFAVAFPTFNEGFGLPIIEAFQLGTPVVASDIAVLHEVAGDFADYFNPNDKQDLVKCVSNLLDSPQDYSSKKEHLKEFNPLTWDQSANQMIQAVSLVNKDIKQVDPNLNVKQIVVLTARNEDILNALPFYDRFMTFITEIVICCPDKNVEELKEKYKGRLTLKFLTDSEVLAGHELPEDHSTRNFFLRCLILQKDIIDDVFIMTDDDYRPLRNITIDDFIQDGRYLAYYCYDLNKWLGKYGNYTSFDLCMARSREFLKEHNYPTMMYSSHQMQIIDKRIFNQMTTQYPDINLKGLCEWCSYFNYAVKNYPDMFKPVLYVAMCWPGERSNWDVYQQPTKFLFENFYSLLYKPNHIFADYSTEYHENIQDEDVEKVMLFSRDLQRQAEGNQVYKSYKEAYWLQYREVPSFVILCGDDKNIAISTPTYIQLKSDCWTRVPFKFDERIVTELGSKEIVLSYWFTSESGNALSAVANHSITPTDLLFHLPLRTPNFTERCVLNLRVILTDKDISTSLAIKSNLI